MNGENGPLVTDELVEFDKQRFRFQDFRKFTYHFRGTYGICLERRKENRKMMPSVLELGLGNTRISPILLKKILPGHWPWLMTSVWYNQLFVGKVNQFYQLDWRKHACVHSNQWAGRFLGTIGWDPPSVCKSNRLHVDILRFSFTKVGYIHSINSSKPISNLPAVLMNFNPGFGRLLSSTS